jgi:hypothetical protein
MRNLWYFQNPDKAKQLRGYRWEEGKMIVFGADHKKNSLILREFQKLDIGKFLDCDRAFCNDSPEVLAVAKWGKGKEAKMLDMEIKNLAPIRYLQSLLAFIGVKLVGKQKKGQKREYSYLPDGGSLPADFNELYAAVSSKMLEKYEEKVQKKEAEKRSAVTPETIDSTELDTVTHLPTMCYTNNVGRCVTQIEVNLPPLTSSAINPDDAEKLRDIALIWWDEYYPEQMQSLNAQMYGWQAPGTKYDVATLAEWLEGEDSLIRDRITELVHLRV